MSNMTELAPYVTVTCIECGAEFTHKRKTYRAYINSGRPFRCEACIRRAHLKRTREKCEATCTERGARYEANKIQYHWKRGRGHPTYCPVCAQKCRADGKHREKELREAYRQDQDQAAGGNGNLNRTGMDRTWGPTPCGKVIEKAPLVPGKGRPPVCTICDVAYNGILYDRCLTAAANRFWPNWRIA
jgi:hypothetical protein